MKYKFLIMTSSRGQAIMNHVIIAGVVTTVMLTMSTSIRRTIQATYKNVADKIGSQDGYTPDPKKGYVDLAVTQEGQINKTTHTEDHGDVILNYDDKTNVPFTQTNSHYGNPPD